MIGPVTIHGVDTAEYLPIFPLAFNPYPVTAINNAHNPSTPSGAHSVSDSRIDKLTYAFVYAMQSSSSNGQGYQHDPNRFLSPTHKQGEALKKHP